MPSLSPLDEDLADALFRRGGTVDRISACVARALSWGCLATSLDGSSDADAVKNMGLIQSPI